MLSSLSLQESGGSGMKGRSFKLGNYAEGNASRDFYRNVSLPIEHWWHLMHFFEISGNLYIFM